MAIEQAICASFKLELLQGLHDFTTDTFRLALYTSAATLGPSTTQYTATGEVSGTGYTAGGESVTVVAPVLDGTVAVVDFVDVSWTSAEFTARGALLYNETAGNLAVAVLDFGSDKLAVGNTFVVQFPSPTSTQAIVRVT